MSFTFSSSSEILSLDEKIETIKKKLDTIRLSFDYVKIRLASPTRVRTWGQRFIPYKEEREPNLVWDFVGEVVKGETVNFRTHEPEPSGLFCQRIFGPIKNWKCACGKYNGFVLRRLCETCSVEINEARTRRYRMGYIELLYPVVHYWYLKGNPNYFLLLLRSVHQEKSIADQPEPLKASDLEDLVYFRPRLKPHPSLEPFLITSYPLVSGHQIFGYTTQVNKFKGMKTGKNFERKGAEILRAALEMIDLEEELQRCRNFLVTKSLLTAPFQHIKHKNFLRKMRILESFLSSETDPSWLVLTVLPVLPPTLRPLVELENGRLVVADVNESYRLVVMRNNRLGNFLYFQSLPELVLSHARKLLQEIVDCLIDNARLPKERKIFLNEKPLKSLTEILEGKQGRFRNSLLGKRVDYSGRSVIVVGPQLRLNQCGLPYEMATELFQPFLVNQLLQHTIKFPSHNTRLANLIIRKNKPFVWTLVAGLSQNYSILLNRAPTLHRFGIQAFDPVIVVGQAIHLHPLVCTGFNADFDGDQMAVHLPLYDISQLEIKMIMRPSYNVLSPANGEVILKPTQDMVIGCYYLTMMITQKKDPLQKWFASPQEALTAFSQKKIQIHTPILVRYRLNSIEFHKNQTSLPFTTFPTYFPQNFDNLQVYKIRKNGAKHYLVTNWGVFVALPFGKEKYQLTDLFLETTVGRLIFTENYKQSIKR